MNDGRATNPLSGVWLGFLMILGAVVLVLGVQGFRQIQTNATSHDVLCALKAKEAGAARRTQKLLDENPGPIVRAYGLKIPRSVLLSNQAETRATLAVFRFLACS